MDDYEKDSRPLPESLREFAVKINNGRIPGSRERAAAELRVSVATYNGWASGRRCSQEGAIRRLMTMIVNFERDNAILRQATKTMDNIDRIMSATGRTDEP